MLKIFLSLFLCSRIAYGTGSAITSTPSDRSIPFDNAGTTFNSTNVHDAIVESANFLTTNEVTATGNTTTTSGTDALINSMTTTPVAGTYMVFFNTDINSNAAGSAISVSYYVGGVQVAATLRKTSHFDGGTLSAGSARAIVSLQSIIAVNGSQAIEVRWSTSSGTATAANRSLITVRVL